MTKEVILLVIIILIFVAGGIFWWQGEEAPTLREFGQAQIVLPKYKSEIEKISKEKLEPLSLRLKELQKKTNSLLEKVEELEKKVENLEEKIVNLSTKKGKENSTKEKKNKKEKTEKKISLCQKLPPLSSRKKVIFNEIAWMGSKNSSANEWIELKNISQEEIDLTGWQIQNENKKIKIIFPKGVKIPPQGFFLLERKSDEAVPQIEADWIYSGALRNKNESLYLFDENCQLQDEIIAHPDWPAGDNSTKRTMERKGDFSWQTSLNPGGTPKAENSIETSSTREEENLEKEKTIFKKEPQPKISLLYPQKMAVDKEIEVSLSVSNLKEATYDLKISIEKEGKVLSEIYNKNKNLWQSSFKYLLEVFSGTSFSDSFKLRIKEDKRDFQGEAKIVAKIRESRKSKYFKFEGKITISQPEKTQNQTSAPNQKIPKNILITEVQIWDASSSNNDFIELYNPNPEIIDISGFQLKKRNSKGRESSICLFPEGTIILGHSHFLWTNSHYLSLSSLADATTTQTLARNNSLALLDKNKNIIDALSWGTSTNPFVEGSSFPQNPTKGKSLARKILTLSGGIPTYLDSENNSQDFEIQEPTPKATNH